MSCYRKILCISYKDLVTKVFVWEEVHAKIYQAIGLHEDLLIMVKRRKLQWYDNVSWSLGLAKTILQGTVKGGRRQGRQRKKWEDNIRVWTGLEFTKSQMAVGNREKWWKLIVKLSVVPQQPLRLMDRWWWTEEEEKHKFWCWILAMAFHFTSLTSDQPAVLLFYHWIRQGKCSSIELCKLTVFVVVVVVVVTNFYVYVIQL